MVRNWILDWNQFDRSVVCWNNLGNSNSRCYDCHSHTGNGRAILRIPSRGRSVLLVVHGIKRAVSRVRSVLVSLRNAEHGVPSCYVNTSAQCRSGWISVFGWWLGLASVCNFVASMFLAMAVLWHPIYIVQRWHQWMVYVGLCWSTVVLNVFGSKIIPRFNQFICTASPPLMWRSCRADLET
jgi:hypothetical protein